MATSELSTVMMEARAALQTSHRLLDEMRTLHLQVNQSLNAVRDSAATLALKVSANTSVGETAVLRSLPAAPAAEPFVLDSPASRQLEAKDQIAFDLLTPREIEVLRLIGEGLRTKEIAFALGITFKTAVTHRSNIMEKLAIHEGPRLVRFAIRTGIATA